MVVIVTPLRRPPPGVLRLDGQRDQRRRGAESGAGDAVVAAPGAVFALDLREARADLLAEGGPLGAAERGLRFRGEHVRDVLLAAVAAEAAHHVVVGERLFGG